jgi:hypothetical protein
MIDVAAHLRIAASAMKATAETQTFLNAAEYVSSNAPAPASMIAGLTPGTDRSAVESCAARSVMKSGTELAGSPTEYKFSYGSN